MAVSISPRVGKVLYALLFNAVLPALLVLWARGASRHVDAVVPHVPVVGWALVAGGLVLLLAGVLALTRHGDGLPMNAYPTKRLVVAGVYGLFAHPIYTGFCALVLGASLVARSPAGTFLVSPVLALSAAALWFGYEKLDLEARLGPRPSVLFDLPEDADTALSWPRRFGALAFALSPALATVALLRGLGVDGSPSALARGGIASAVLVALAVVAPLAARTSRAWRQFVLAAWLESLLVGLAVVAGPRGPWGPAWELSTLDTLAAALAVSGVLRAVASLRTVPPAGAVVAASLVGLVAGLPEGLGARAGEVVCALAVAVVAERRSWLWSWLLRGSERIANMWSERRFGPVRLINHGVLAAAGVGLGATYAGCLVGAEHAATVFLAGVAALVGSALWAQLIEGSPSLSRPYGFFGGLLAIVVVVVGVAPAWPGTPAWLGLGAFAAAGPWIQGLARLRCLANGCCHGAPCARSFGIVYRHPRTRPVRLAALEGVPLHPTQLYSLLSNVAIGLVLARLWGDGAALPLVVGLYLVLMGLARFVEEAWRGEPQTPVYAGLRLYQWVALACLVVGAVVTCVDGPPAPAPQASWPALWFGAALFGLVWVATSIDFPDSRRRFARLA